MSAVLTAGGGPCGSRRTGEDYEKGANARDIRIDPKEITMSRKRRPNKQFRENTSMTRAQKREAGLLVATGHPSHTGRKTTMDTRPRGQRDRHNARRVAIARAMD